MKRLSRLCFAVVSVLSSLALILAILAPSINPGTFYWPAILALGIPILLPLHFVLLLYWLLKDYRWMLLHLLLLILALPAIHRTFQFKTDRRTQEDQTLKIATYNVFKFKKFRFATEEKKEHLLSEWQKEMRQFDGVDILCLQEYSKAARAFMLENFEHDYGAKCSGIGNVRILSRYPITAKGCIQFAKRRKQVIWADIAIPSDTIRVYSIHLESNHISQYEQNFLEDDTLDLSSSYEKVKRILATYKNIAPQRVTQAEKLLHHVSTSPHPVLLAGDFNEIPQSRVYKLMSENHEDTFLSEGYGMGVTYNGRFPFLRIDYIFADPQFEVVDFRRGDLGLSDHLPVMVSVKLRDENGE